MHFFRVNIINEIAVNVGFKKRTGKLEPLTFVKAFVIGILNKSNITVQDIAIICTEIQPGLKITSSAINQRLKMGGLLMKEIFKLAMECSTKQAVSVETVKILTQFNNVYVCDASTISLPDKLAKEWKGLGGTNSKAALKIQVMFNILTKTYKKIDIVDATENDAKYMTEIVKQSKKNDLSIVDLGYFNTVTKLQSELLGFNILITNTTEEMISAESICDVYRIRWQIELIFKSWKGINGIDKLSEVNSDCLDCIIYGRLTMLVLMSNMFAMLYRAMYKKLSRRVSLLKFYKQIKYKNTKILDNIGLKSCQINNLIDILETVAQESLYDKRKRKTSIETLEEYDLCYYYIC